MIAPFPLNEAPLIPNLSQPFDEVVNGGGAGERYNCFDVGDAVNTIQRSREHLGGASRTNQRIWLVG